MKKKQTSNVPAPFFSPVELSDGQFTFLPEMPGSVKMMRGPVIDEVMDADCPVDEALLVDDTYNNVKEGVEPLPITTRVMLSYDGVSVETANHMALTAIDREVIDAVASLMYCNEYITPEMIYRVMMGKKKYQKVTESQRNVVRESMLRCSQARLRIDLTDMLERDSRIGRYLKGEDVEASISDTLLSFQELSFKARGKMEYYYKVSCQPALFRYAVSMGQISEFPLELLDTKLNKTEPVIILQSAMLRAIAAMYRGETPHFIPVNTIYRAVGKEDDTRVNKARLREKATRILDSWVEMRFIAGYQTHRSGSYFKGYSIDLSDKTQLPVLLQEGPGVHF